MGDTSVHCMDGQLDMCVPIKLVYFILYFLKTMLHNIICNWLVVYYECCAVRCCRHPVEVEWYAAVGQLSPRWRRRKPWVMDRIQGFEVTCDINLSYWPI